MWKKILWTLFNINQPIPIDKLSIIIIIIMYYNKTDIKQRSKLVAGYSLLCLTVLISFLINPNRNILIFYPLILSFTAALVSKTNISLKLIQDSLLLNIYSGLILSIAATILNTELPGTLSLIEKAMPFIYAPIGFCPTLQVYGTLCIAWIFISFESKQKKTISFYLIIFAAIITFNRATLLFLIVLLFIYKTKPTIIIISIISCFLLSIDIIQDALLSSSTLNSRNELRVGAELSYWNSHDMITYLIGKGSHMTTEAIANKTIWGRQYIENGFDFIFHSYGIIGFIIYNIIIAYLLYKAILNKQLYLTLIIIYYYYIEQFLTNEYLTSSFVYISLIILTIIKHNSNHEKSIDNSSII